MDVVGDEFLRAEDDAAEAAALAVDVLGGGIDHAVGAELERALPQRRREHVVDDQRRAGGVRDLGDLGDVEHFEIGIGRRLEEAGLGVRPHRRAPGVEVEAVDDRRGHAVARQVVLHHVEAGAEDRLRRHDMVAGLDLAHHRERDRGHAGRDRARGFRALEFGDALLEHVHGRIGEARILVAGVLALEAGLGLRGIVVDVALGEEQRLRRLAELRAQDAGLNQAGFGAVLVGFAASLDADMCGPPSALGQQKTGRKNPGRAHVSPAF